MSKAILVIDMPKNCQGCKLKSRVQGIQNVTHCCNLAEGMITLDKGFEGRLPNCPLKTLPEPIDISGCKTEITKARAQEYNSLLAKLNN